MTATPDKNLSELFRKELKRCCTQIKRSSFQQEPNYVAALMGKLSGLSISENGFSIQTTIVNDRGPKSAEKEFGADFAIVLISPSGFKKAILGQAKGSNIAKMSVSSRQKFDTQCNRILKHSRQFLALAAPTDTDPIPQVWLGSGPPATTGTQMSLVDYLVDEFLSCQHGDKRAQFAQAVTDSKLLQLRMLVAE